MKHSGESMEVRLDTTGGLRLEDVDVQLLVQDTDELLSTSSVKIPLTSGQRRDLYRRRRKEEREWLVQQRERMTKEIEKIRSRRGEIVDPSGLQSTWRVIVQKEKCRRVVAETHNKRLRNTVEGNAELIQDLKQLFDKRLRRENLEVPIFVAQELSDEALFEEHLAGLDAVYRQTDEIFRSCGSPSLDSSGEFEKKCEGNTEYFQTIDLMHLPFEFHRICSAMWEIMSLPHRQIDRKLYSALRLHKKLFAVKFRVRCQRQVGEDVVVMTHFVARRYEEEHRTVVVWSGLLEAEEGFTGVCAKETGWCVAYPVPETSCQSLSTLVQKCVRVVPLHFGESKLKVNEFLKLILRQYEDINSIIEDALERLDDCAVENELCS